jgi:hypothetical protein
VNHIPTSGRPLERMVELSLGANAPLQPAALDPIGANGHA